MINFLKQCWNDWVAAEQELCNMGIIRVYTIYGIIDYYDCKVAEKENAVEDQKDNMV